MTLNVFSVLICVLYIFTDKASVHILSQFKKCGLFVFLLLGFMSPMYILQVSYIFVCMCVFIHIRTYTPHPCNNLSKECNRTHKTYIYMNGCLCVCVFWIFSLRLDLPFYCFNDIFWRAKVLSFDSFHVVSFLYGSFSV